MKIMSLILARLVAIMSSITNAKVVLEAVELVGAISKEELTGMAKSHQMTSLFGDKNKVAHLIPMISKIYTRTLILTTIKPKIPQCLLMAKIDAIAVNNLVIGHENVP